MRVIFKGSIQVQCARFKSNLLNIRCLYMIPTWSSIIISHQKVHQHHYQIDILSQFRVISETVSVATGTVVARFHRLREDGPLLVSPNTISTDLEITTIQRVAEPV